MYYLFQRPEFFIDSLFVDWFYIVGVNSTDKAISLSSEWAPSAVFRIIGCLCNSFQDSTGSKEQGLKTMAAGVPVMANPETFQGPKGT